MIYSKTNIVTCPHCGEYPDGEPYFFSEYFSDPKNIDKGDLSSFDCGNCYAEIMIVAESGSTFSIASESEE